MAYTGQNRAQIEASKVQDFGNLATGLLQIGATAVANKYAEMKNNREQLEIQTEVNTANSNLQAGFEQIKATVPHTEWATKYQELYKSEMGRLQGLEFSKPMKQSILGRFESSAASFKSTVDVSYINAETAFQNKALLDNANSLEKSLNSASDVRNFGMKVMRRSEVLKSLVGDAFDYNEKRKNDLMFGTY